MTTRILAPVFTLLVTASLSFAAVCGESEDVQRTVDVGTLTFEEVQQRALAAVQRQGEVYHVVATTESDDGTYAEDVWVYVDEDVARRQSRGGESIDLQYPGRRASVFDERFFDAPCEPCGDNAAARLAPHLNWILDESYTDRSLEEGTVDGRATIRVDVSREYGGDYTGEAKATIDLDESFLPIRMKIDPPGPLATRDTTFESEFAPRATVAPDFFSPDALRTLAAGPTSDLDQAVENGLDVLWLGETFEDMVLRDETDFYVEGEYVSGDPFLNLSYGPVDPMQPAPCVNLTAQRLSSDGWAPVGAVMYGTIDVGGLEARLYRAERFVPVAPTGADPAGSDPAFPPANTVIPAATATAGGQVEGDTGTIYIARITSADTALEIAANCGPVGSNVYRTEEAFGRVVAALRPYEAPATSP